MEANFMELLNNFINQVYNFIMPLIDWMVFLLVLASGYFVRVTKVLPKLSKTLKILVFSLIVTILYSFASGVEPGIFIASYFIAFGFHSAVLKMFERKIAPMVTSVVQKIVGDRPTDR